MIEASGELLAHAAESIRRLQPTVAAATDTQNTQGHASRCGCSATQAMAWLTSSR